MATTEQQQQRERGSRAAASFDEVIAPLEAKAGQPLAGFGRGKCIAAFSESPEGFCRVVEGLHKREGVRNLLGLLVHAIKDGDHQLPAPAPATNGNGARASRELCPDPDCEMPVDGRHTADCKLAGSGHRRVLLS